MSNSSLTKKVLHEKSRLNQKLTRKGLGLDRKQKPKTMIKRNDFVALLDQVYDPSKQSRLNAKKSRMSMNA